MVFKQTFKMFLNTACITLIITFANEKSMKIHLVGSGEASMTKNYGV